MNDALGNLRVQLERMVQVINWTLPVELVSIADGALRSLLTWLLLKYQQGFVCCAGSTGVSLRVAADHGA